MHYAESPDLIIMLSDDALKFGAKIDEWFILCKRSERKNGTDKPFPSKRLGLPDKYNHIKYEDRNIYRSLR